MTANSKSVVRTRLLCVAILVVLGLWSVAQTGPASAAPPFRAEKEPKYLSPSDLVLSPDGLSLFVVCEGDDALLAVDLRARRSVAKVRVGKHPRGVALSPNGATLYVANEWSDTVTEVDSRSFTVQRTFKTGWGPVGLAADAEGKFLYVANSISNDVSVLELSRGREVKRLAAWRSPHEVVLSRDGRHVYVSNLLPHLTNPDQPPISELTVIDTRRQIVNTRILIPGAIELRQVAEAPAPAGGYVLVPLMRSKNLGPMIQVAQGWIATHGMALLRIDSSVSAFQSLKPIQVLLDDVDYYYAGTNGATFTPDGRYALVTSSEADVVTIIDTAKLRIFLGRRSPDAIPNRLDSARHFVVKRLPTRFNPTAVVTSPDGRFAYIANRLDDSISVVDMVRLENAGEIDLDGPKQITSVRRGERLFHSAKFCFQGQFACATCHPDDHIDGLAWNLETPQLGRDRVLNRTLRGIAETAPYKWNGHNPDLETQAGPRSAKFLFHSEGFNAEQVRDVVAYIKSIPLPRNRHLAVHQQLTPAQERGRKLFFEKKCDSCHPPQSHYTTRTSADVGTATKHDTSGLFDIPHLDRIYDRPPYLHSGQALSLEEIWTKFNVGDKHGVTSDMSKEQLNDLVEYLKTM